MMQGWMPIETAPRDGTRILGYAPAYNPQMVMVYWKPGCGLLADNGRGGFIRPEGCWSVKSNKSHGGITHWQPLPDPPNAP